MAALDDFTRRWFGDTTPESPAHGQSSRSSASPSGAIRPYLIASRPPPRSLEKPTLAAARAALAARDSTGSRLTRTAGVTRQPSTVTPDAGSPLATETRSCHAARRDTGLVETGR